MTCADDHARHVDLTWSLALDQAIRAVERQRAIAPGQLDLESQCTITIAVAAGLAAFAAHAGLHGVTWADAENVGLRELDETARCRTALP